MMRILVTGPRQWTDRETLRWGLDQAAGLAFTETITLVHGGAEGFDLMCAEEASERGWGLDLHEARWKLPNGRKDLSAGHRRNQAMVDSGADVCLAGIMPCIKPRCGFPPGHPTHGTMDCAGRVLLAGIPLFTVRPGEEK